MGFWYYFWTANFIVAGSSFVLITLVVMVRGSKDLLDMLSRLKNEQTSQNEATKQRPSRASLKS
jgi:hypothetical protein